MASAWSRTSRWPLAARRMSPYGAGSTSCPGCRRFRVDGALMVKEAGRKLIAQNRKARHDYAIEDVVEAGIVLTGTVVPLTMYFKDGRAKVEIALARGKKSYDKRQDMATRDAAREVARELGRRAKGRI